MKHFDFDISAGNTIGRSGKPRTVYGSVAIDVNSTDFRTDEEDLIRQELIACADSIRRRLERSFPLPTKVRNPPSNFLEEHVLEMLTLEPTWTLNMYAVYNDLSEEITERLRTFLKNHLPAHRIE
jgi:hypothetical protein